MIEMKDRGKSYGVQVVETLIVMTVIMIAFAILLHYGGRPVCRS